ncbi:MAG: fatty acid desaturase [Chthoniobacteraceae bacterium]
MNAPTAIEAEPHEPHWISRSAFQIVSILFFSTENALGFAVAHNRIWLAVPLALIASHFMHGLLVGFHEASHGLLRGNRVLNDLEGVLIGVFSFLPFTLYRVVHQTHHAHLATERDQEMWPLVQPQNPRWARVASAFLELNAALIFSPLIFLRAFFRRGSQIRSSRVRRRIWAELLLTAIVWSGILWAVDHLDAWKYFLWLYLAPAFIAANLQSWRKYIEHVGMTGSTVVGSTRSIVAETWAGRLVAFTLLHEPFHGVHHQRAGLPHAELPQHLADLMPKTAGERAPYLSYRQALADLIRSLADPRAGAQWNTATARATGLRT